MDILLKEVKQKFINASATIDELISDYLTKRLGINNINTINTLTVNEKGTYNDRLDLLLKVTSPTTIQTGKIQVFKDLCKRFSNIKYYDDLEHCFNLMPSNVHFLFIIYPQKIELTNEDKFKLASYELIEDIIQIINQLTAIHKISIVEDDGSIENSFSLKNIISVFFRKAMF